MSTDLIECRMAWWFRFYIFGIAIICLLADREPIQEKSLYWAKRALRASRNGKSIKIP